MWKAILCDDEPIMTKQLETDLNRYGSETGEEICVRTFADGESLLADSGVFTADLLLLDIAMGTKSGIDVARELRKRGCGVTIIFITTMVQYALEGYEVHAFGFLRKPVEYNQLKLVLSEALSALELSKGRQLVIPGDGRTEIVSSREIVFFEAFHHEIRIHLKNGRQIVCTQPLAQFENDVSSRSFFRIHKSYLIHLAEVKLAEADSVVLSDGSRLPISKYRRREFLAAFAAYCGRNSL